jgi:hypothetical protein
MEGTITMKPTDLKIGDTLLFHSEPEAELERIVPFGIQQLTKSEYNHVATYLGDGVCIGALAQGYTIQTLQKAILKTDRVDVYRYHADADELTPEQQKKLVKWCLDHEGVPYDYLDIAFLAILCEINDTTWESLILRKEFEFLIHVATIEIEDFIRANKSICDQIMGNAINIGKGLLICSQAGYLALTEGSEVIIRIKDDEERKKSYADYCNGKYDIVDRYKQINNQDSNNHIISDFVVPRDVALSEDLPFIDKLEMPI